MSKPLLGVPALGSPLELQRVIPFTVSFSRISLLQCHDVFHGVAVEVGQIPATPDSRGTYVPAVDTSDVWSPLFLICHFLQPISDLVSGYSGSIFTWAISGGDDPQIKITFRADIDLHHVKFQS